MEQGENPLEEALAMFRQWNLLPVFGAIPLIILLVCGACSGRQREPGPLVEDILNDTPCAIPCWQGILPGKTTKQEAIAILFAEARPSYIGDPSIYREWETDPIIRWFTKGAQVPPALAPLGKWPMSAPSVSEVQIRGDKVCYTALTLDRGLTAQMVIDKWGNPSKVSVMIIGVEYIEARAGLLYPEQGIAFSVYLNPKDRPLVLNPDSQVVGARLYAPLLMEQWLESEHLECASRPDTLLDWQGFGAYSLSSN